MELPTADIADVSDSDASVVCGRGLARSWWRGFPRDRGISYLQAPPTKSKKRHATIKHHRSRGESPFVCERISRMLGWGAVANGGF